MILPRAQQKHIFWSLVHTCLWNEPRQVFYKVVFAEFVWKSYCFWNLKTGEWDLKTFLSNNWNDFVSAQQKHFFWKSVHTCPWNQPPQVSARVVFAVFKWKYHCFWNLKTGEWDLKTSLFNYWNDLALG